MPPELSGKFVVRLPPNLHASLKRRARELGVSLNGLCLTALNRFLGRGIQEDREGMDIPVRKVQDLLGESLSGLLLFGSAARGESRESSDIDLLIVVGEGVPLTRLLYDRWDRSMDDAGVSRLSPHFVHLPVSSGGAGSVWYEAAVDGIVLLDRDGRISRFLGTVRRAMAEGALQRKSAHGHPYWIRRGREVTHA